MPEILHEGKYRVYQKDDGGLRIQYRRTDKDEDDFLEIPGPLLRMAERLSDGKLSPLAAFRALRSGNFDPVE